jgi:uncharacterized membrane protein
MDSDVSLLLACPACAAQMPETAAYCPSCGRRMPAAIRPEGAVSRLPENLAAALAYVTFIPALIFLFLDPYKKNRLVRFHSIQCLLLWAVMLAILALLRLAGLAVFLIPVAGPLLMTLISVIAGLAAFLLWVVLIAKALRGEMFKLPVLGEWAEQRSRSA